MMFMGYGDFIRAQDILEWVSPEDDFVNLTSGRRASAAFFKVMVF